MFDYKASTKAVTIEALQTQNAELRQQVTDHQTNLKLNKEAIRDLLAAIRVDKEEVNSKAHRRKRSWWGTKDKEPDSAHNKTYLVNTINNFVTENLNLQNEVFRIQEILDNTLKESAEIKYQLAKRLHKKPHLKVKDAGIQVDLKGATTIAHKVSDTSHQNQLISKLKAKLRIYIKKISSYQRFLRSLVCDYSMPSELINDIQEMQVNDSFKLVNSYLDITSNVDINSQLYDRSLDEGLKKEDTLELLDQDFSKELKDMKLDISGDTTNKPTDI